MQLLRYQLAFLLYSFSIKPGRAVSSYYLFSFVSIVEDEYKFLRELDKVKTYVLAKLPCLNIVFLNQHYLEDQSTFFFRQHNVVGEYWNPPHLCFLKA